MESRSQSWPCTGLQAANLLCADPLRRLIYLALLSNTGFKLVAEVLDRAAQGLDGTRGVGAESLTRAEVIAQLLQGFDVASLSGASLQGAQGFHAPRQAIAARGAETAGLAGKKLFHVAQQRDHVDALVDRHG